VRLVAIEKPLQRQRDAAMQSRNPQETLDVHRPIAPRFRSLSWLNKDAAEVA
jgi:hypothetical protein